MEDSPFLHNIDDEKAFDLCQSQLGTPDVNNFAIQFDAEAANCALNLSETSLTNVLAQRKDSSSQQCLWLNLWGWSTQHHEVVGLIARHYNVSPRLAHMLCPKLYTRNPTSCSSSSIDRKDPSSPAVIETEKASSASSDIEAHAATVARPKQKLLTSIADVAEDLWHFCTVDYGQRYICIGWNALFFAPDETVVVPDSKPNAIRIWSSLLLCDDGTILSVFESPPGVPSSLLKKIRFNQINIFRHLARPYLTNAFQNALMQVTIRPAPGSTGGNRASDLASLLFYYLFDDWLNIYAQVAGGENSYRWRLEQLRDQMTTSPEVEQVKTLHKVGRQLTVLKSVYKSYEAVIDRIVQKQRSLAGHDRFSSIKTPPELVRSQSSQYDDLASPLELDDVGGTNVRLTANATARLERLRDRIDICAMTEVEECLKEKESLVMMNFNLVSLKESQAVEKLTRTTILLAKVTILFLPVSLVTAYFSMTFPAIEHIYTLRTYWLTFLVVAIVTVLFLLLFGAFSERVKGRVIYKSLSRTFLDRQKNKMR